MTGMQPRQIVAVIFPGLQSLDLTGPLEVFSLANRLSGRSEYTVTVAAARAGTVVTSSGLGIVAGVSVRRVVDDPDTLLVVGGLGIEEAAADTELVGSIRRLAGRSRRVASVCTGAFLLAEAGLLDGRRAATHWSAAGTLADRYPAVRVDAGPIFVRDGNVATSAGITAGIDLALALVQEDAGRDLALAVARQLVVFLQRPADQRQLSVQLVAQLTDSDALREAQRLVAEQPGADLSVRALAAHVGMSERHFARCFRAEVGEPPGRYVALARVEAARRMLQDSSHTVAEVASACGFGTPETMRRTMVRVLGAAPSELRRRTRAMAS